MTDKKPFEIARETLKQLTAKKLAPTPVNYQNVYNEIAGIPAVQPFPDEQLRAIAQGLPIRNPGQEKQKGLLEFAINQANWQSVQAALLGYAGFIMPPPAGTAATEAPKLEAVVANTGAASGLTPEFMQQIARLIEFTLPALGEGEDARFHEQVERLLAALREPAPDLPGLKAQLANFSHRLSFAAEDQAEIKATLLKLLHLIVESIGQISVDDSWLQGQVALIKTAATPPLTLRRLDEVERQLKDLIFKQTEARGRAQEAQEELRQLLATFLARLSQMADSSSSFHGKMEEGVRQIEQARSLEDLGPVLREVLKAARNMSDESRTMRDELQLMRSKTQTTQSELARLHQELDRISTQARHDALTGALNRQGLDEALNREIATVRRKDAPLCVALLDIDNFKKLNDSKGHAAGDAALTHLAKVARDCMRPQDTLARYGGEEFVILLPDTPLERGIDAMARLQRELSTRFFMADNEKVLITFSAGVAQFAADETGADAIRRADQAMYLAKRAGKNRVLGA